MHKQFGGENAGTQSSTSTTSETSNAVVSSQELSLGQVINLLQSLSEKVNEATDSFIEEFKETYGMPSRSNIMQFQQGMMQMSERSTLLLTSIVTCLVWKLLYLKVLE